MLTVGLILLLVGVALIVAEAHVTSGALGAGGVLALAAGVGLAVTGVDGAIAVAVAAALATGLAVAGTLVFAGRKVLTAQRALPVGGERALVGCTGVVRTWTNGAGQVALRGEVWRARLSLVHEEESPPRPGDPVVVEAVRDLTLSVRKAEPWETA